MGRQGSDGLGPCFALKNGLAWLGSQEGFYNVGACGGINATHQRTDAQALSPACHLLDRTCVHVHWYVCLGACESQEQRTSP